MNYYDLVELASKSPVVKKYGLDPEVLVMFALVLDKYVRIQPNVTESDGHGVRHVVKLGGGNISVAKFARMLSHGLEEVRSES